MPRRIKIVSLVTIVLLLIAWPTFQSDSAASYSAPVPTPTSTQSPTPTPPPCASLTFQPAVNFPAGYNTGPVGVGDFNLDGRQDLAVGVRTDSAVRILLADGLGGFGPPTTIATNLHPDRAMAVGDYNGDGVVDLAVASHASDRLSILTGDGTGSFQSGATYATETGAFDVVKSDFNQDGKLDLALALPAAHRVLVRLGDGDGSFPTTRNLSIQGEPESLAVGDFNRDGRQDLATWNDINNVSILLNIGGGNFAAPSNVSTNQSGGLNTFIVGGDFNRDGKPDIALADSGDRLRTLIGNGSGGFTLGIVKEISPGVTASSQGVVVGDFNYDGNPDLAVVSEGPFSAGSPSHVTIFEGDGSGDFPAQYPVGVGQNASSIGAGDFNQDGFIDLVALNDNVSLLFNHCEPFTDTDSDGIDSDVDNCPAAPNPDQANTDGDTEGDACDSDDDNDLYTDGADNCPLTLNNQADADTDGAGDACDPDDDNDGSTDEEEAGAGTDPTNADSDGDSLADGPDNCPSVANADQADADADGLGNVCDPINGKPGLSYETLHHISFEHPRIRLAGFGFDPQNRPALGWSESSANGGVNNFRWSRREAGVWVQNTMTQPGCCGGIRAAQPDFILRQDGTPFFAYAWPAYYIYGGTWYAAHVVDLNANPTGPGENRLAIESYTSCIAAYPKFAMDFLPGNPSPSLLTGTHCQYNGWLVLNYQPIHGKHEFNPLVGQGGEFHSIDYATGPDGSHHATYYAERGGPDGWGAYYSNGSPGHEVRLAVPHRNRAAETSVAVGPDGRIHVAIGGVPLCNNTFEGGLLYLTSTDGVNWTRTFVDTLSGRNPSIVLDAAGNPHIAYWRYNNEVRYASLEGDAWSTTPIYVATTPVGLTSVKLAFDASDRPHVLFFNPDTSDITIASGAHSNLPPAVTNPGGQISAAGNPASLQIQATDTEAGALTYSACNLPPGLSIDPVTGNVTGTITPGTPGSYNVTVTVSDPAGNSANVGFDWEVTANRPPALMNPGDQTDAENSAVSLQVSAADVDGDSLTYTAAGLPPGLSINPASGLISGSLGFDSVGSYPVTVSVSDGSLSASASFNWTVTDVNRAPVAAGASAATDEDAAVEVALAASDPDGDALTYAIAEGPGHGSATLSGGIVTYTPAPNYHGQDSFTFRAHDGAGWSNVAAVVITVSPVNDAPAAADDAATTDEDTAVSIDVLANDADLDGDALSVQSVAGGAHGTLAISGSAVVYTPEANYYGADSFSYTVSDGHGGTSEATVSVTVAPVNDAPAASDDSATTPEDVGVQIAVLSNDTDVDGDTPALASVTQPANGVAAINPDGTVSYTPSPNFFGADSFTYTVSDGRGGAATATVCITASPVNDAPVASDRAATLAEDTQVEVTLAAADVDSAALGFAVVGQPLNGTLSAVTGDKVIYTPNPDFNGADSFTFIANDGAADSNLATVTIGVLPVADPPLLATLGNQVVAEGAPLSFTLSVSDLDGDELTFSATGLPDGASLDPETGAFSWTPTYEQAGAYTVTFTVTDPGGLSASEIVTVTVNDVVLNFGPVCSAAYPSISEIWPPNHHRTETVSIFGVTDPDSDPLTITVRRILQDEPTNTFGDGNTWIDGGGIGTPQAWVRAERSGTPKVPGNGRVYEIFFEASDGRGKVCTGSVKVGVPHDQGGRRMIVDDGKRYDSTVAGGPCLNCQ